MAVVGGVVSIQSPGPTVDRGSPGVFPSAAPSLEQTQVIKFPYHATLPSYYDLAGQLQNYTDTDIFLSFAAVMDVAPTASINWTFSFRPIIQGTDLSAGFNYGTDEVSRTSPVLPGQNQVGIDEVTIPQADLGGMVDGDRFILRIGRAAAGQNADVYLLWPNISLKDA